MQKSRYTVFIQNLAQDALTFLFLLLVLSVFRAAFLVTFADSLAPDTALKDIFLAMWYGLRIGLKTAGACVLPAFVFGTVLASAWPKWNGPKFRFWYTCTVLFLLSVLFEMRIPYYHEFHNAFSPFIFNTFHDDVGAIVSTSIEQYHAVSRTVAAFLITGVWGVLFRWWLKLTPHAARPLLTVRRPWIAVTVICILLVPFAVFVRYGGAFTFNGSIYWKNAARLNQHVLNEAVLDDIQALYRASRIYKKLRKSATQVNAQEVRAAAARLSEAETFSADDLLPLLTRSSAGATGEKPQHIFVIVAETYMLWPLLDEYKNYPLADGMRRLIARPDAVFVKNFLPASNGTMFGLTSVLLGIPELNLQAANRPTAQAPYETALSVQLRKLGYKTRFFYGGFASWENVGQFVKNQQVDESFYAADFGANGGVWGVADREFLAGIPEHINPEPSFNLILTSSNHPPYKVDTTREPDLPTIADFEKMLPAQTADKELVAARMWHFAYADKYLAQFVEEMSQQYPNSLFVITGDHADRWTLTPSPSDYERVAVPLVIIGPQLKGKRVPANHAASHMDIAATVLEMVLPKGSNYYALGQNIFTPKNPVGVAAYHWITPRELGRVSEEHTELLPGETTPLTKDEREKVRARVKDLQTVTAWRVLKGIKLEK